MKKQSRFVFLVFLCLGGLTIAQGCGHERSASPEPVDTADEWSELTDRFAEQGGSSWNLTERQGSGSSSEGGEGPQVPPGGDPAQICPIAENCDSGSGSGAGMTAQAAVTDAYRAATGQAISNARSDLACMGDCLAGNSGCQLPAAVTSQTSQEVWPSDHYYYEHCVSAGYEESECLQGTASPVFKASVTVDICCWQKCTPEDL